jgi:hypothetical protein
MEPILLIHGYSTEGKDKTVDKIYGSLPAQLRKLFGRNNVKELNLSRWISLNDGIRLDDVSFAMNIALNEEYPHLLESGFHVIIHSTGALVVRNWIKKFSPKPCPIINLVHLAGANFGSGLAHVGQGQLSRWKNSLTQGTGVGTKVLHELEFGSWKTLDLHLHFLKPGNDIYHDYHVQEFNIIGSQTLAMLHLVPIRYVKEDSSDNTVRTSASNLNFNYIPVNPSPKAYTLSVRWLKVLTKKRLENKEISDMYYDYDLSYLSSKRQAIPFAIAYETAHFGDDIGIVSGKLNRTSVMPLIRTALNTPYRVSAYQRAVERFDNEKDKTLERAGRLDNNLAEWNKQSQYEGHSQLIFRIRDQFGNGVEHFDVTFKSTRMDKSQKRLERMIEDRHANTQDKGTITFYLRTVNFIKRSKNWRDLLSNIAACDIEITGTEPESDDIAYVPLNMRLDSTQVKTILESFKTTIIDITLVRLPSNKVFEINRA